MENVEEPVTTRTQQPYTPTEKLMSYKAAKLTPPCLGFVDASRSGTLAHHREVFGEIPDWPGVQ